MENLTLLHQRVASQEQLPFEQRWAEAPKVHLDLSQMIGLIECFKPDWTAEQRVKGRWSVIIMAGGKEYNVLEDPGLILTAHERVGV